MFDKSEKDPKKPVKTKKMLKINIHNLDLIIRNSSLK